jgi:hypothetical protein
MRKLTASGLGAMVLGVLFLAGCGGGGGGTNTTPGILLPVVTITPSAAQSIDQGQSLALSASVANDTGSAGVSWSVVGGGTLSGTTTSATTYTAPASVAAATTATVTATSVASSSATATHAVVVNPAPAITTSGALTAATVNTAYSATLAATGGAGSLTWSVATGSILPAGLTLSKAGVLAGTPTTTGTNGFNVQVTDASAAMPMSATAALSLAVNTAALTITAPTLAAATAGQAYTSAAFTATGGTGAVTWSATGLPAGLTIGASSGIIGGTPAAAGTSSNIVVTATDSGVGAAQQVKSTAALSLAVNPAALSLPAPNPASLPVATDNVSYSGAITASGGVAGYTWTVNGAAVPTNSTPVTLAGGLGLSVSSDGSATLSVSGTPSGNGTVSFTAAVQDGGGASAGPNSYTVAVLYAVKGTVRLVNVCGSTAAPGVSVAINTTPAQTVMTDSNGNYAFNGIPNGAYILTPSLAGPRAAFVPATLPVTVNNADSGFNFINADLGYNVSGTVAYAGVQTGRIYLTLTSSSCGNGSGPGVSLAAPGAFAIRGVPPGSYTLQAGMDAQGTGHVNTQDPSGSTTGVSVSGADATGVAVTLTDASAPTLAAPVLQGVNPINQGAIVEYGSSTAANGLEAASYTLQWSTVANFSSITSGQTFPANGSGNSLWLLHALTNGSVYYFRALGTSGASTSPASNVIGPVTIGAPTGGNPVTGTVTFSVATTQPLYTGLFDPLTGHVFAQYLPSPTSPTTYSVQAPNGSYQQVGILDLNGNGIVDTGDIANLKTAPTLTVSGATNSGLTLTGVNSTASVTTQHYVNGPDLAHSLSSYALTFAVDPGQKLPVAVALTSGPNLATPMDLGQCLTCGGKFQYSVSVGSTVPQAGDTYSLLVTYSDGTSETLSAAVSAVITGLPTNLAPATSGSGNTTPTFTWTDPASAGNYTYSFQLTDSNNNTIWQIPGTNSAALGFASTITSITWGTDPTGNATNVPTPAALTTGNMYFWSIQIRDSNGNSATWLTNYQP